MTVGAESVPPQKYIQKNGTDIVACYYCTSKTTKFTQYELKNECSLDAERWESHWSIVTELCITLKKQQRWTYFLWFADYFLALYSQATMSLTWEGAEELSDDSVEQVCPAPAHTRWWEQVVEISRIFKPVAKQNRY